MNTIGQKIIFDSDCVIDGANGVSSRGMQWRASVRGYKLIRQQRCVC